MALAQAAPTLPAGRGWWFEPKYDGDRMLMWRVPGGVRLQSRSGRDVTAWWPDLAAAGAALPVGVVLDGEAVVWTGGQLDFGAVRSRASSSPARAASLARALPASYAVWDLLAHPEHGDIRRWAYTRRRALLLDVLGPRGRPPIQPTPATDDRAVAGVWLEQLIGIGVEGIVCKRGSSTYRVGRVWTKVRHSDTVDGQVVGITGTATRPGHAVVRLPDGRVAVSQALPGRLAAQLGRRVRGQETGGGTAPDGRRYTIVAGGVLVEVLAGTTRHPVVTVTRLRD
ncbi:ATP-dependent DNA ligase [Streptomyces sp. Iso 434]|uniref:ATP-dependent DNA ligase n=1 Tax=Streptomyces sp. Iso 434 TaxID=3062272 RepID=UPI00397EED4D